MSEYVIINAETIQQRIEELEKERLLELKDDFYDSLYLGEINALKQILSQSTPLIPEIEKAILEGVNSIHFENDGSHWTNDDVVEDYISNLKLDI